MDLEETKAVSTEHVLQTVGNSRWSFLYAVFVSKADQIELFRAIKNDLFPDSLRIKVFSTKVVYLLNDFIKNSYQKSCEWCCKGK